MVSPDTRRTGGGRCVFEPVSYRFCPCTLLIIPRFSDNAQQAAREYPNVQWQHFFSEEQLRLEWTRYCDRASWRDGRKVAWEHGWATLDEAQPLTERSTGCILQARELRCAGDRDTDKRRLENVKDAQGSRRHQMYYAVATDQATVISAHKCVLL